MELPARPASLARGPGEPQRRSMVTRWGLAPASAEAPGRSSFPSRCQKRDRPWQLASSLSSREMSQCVVATLVALLLLCGLVGAAAASRANRAGTGLLLGLLLGPFGLLIVWRRREGWIQARAIRSGAAEREREEQAQREWRGY